jgi:hypothetical protein
MHDGAPAQQDKPDTLPMLDEVLSLAPALEAGWAAESAAIPPGTLRNEGEPEAGDEPGGDTTALGPDEGEPGGSEEAESFYDFDPSQVPDDADRDWLGNKYSEMRSAFTKKAQEFGEGRRAAEESQALIEGLRDPETMPHYLRLLGVDLSNPQHLQSLGINVQAADDDLAALLDDEEPDPTERVEQLEALIAQEREEGEAAAELQALDDLADQELEGIEQQWGRKLTDVEDEILRQRAENNPGPDGLPDYASAANVLKGALNQGVEHELKRRREGGGRGAPGGRPGGKALDPNKDEDRLALGAAAAERAMASQQ